jgi:hypothetical protein
MKVHGNARTCPKSRGFEAKRRRDSNPRPSAWQLGRLREPRGEKYCRLQGFCHAVADSLDQTTGEDMRQCAAFRALVRTSARNPRWRFDSAYLRGSPGSAPYGPASITGRRFVNLHLAPAQLALW